MTHKNILLGTSLVLGLSLGACVHYDPDLAGQKACKDRCEEIGNTQFNTPLGSVWVQSVNGMLEHPHKGANLNPECFARKPLEVKNANGNPKLAELDLTPQNTTIMLINFTEDGALESHSLSDIKGSQSKAVKNRINRILTSPPSDKYSEYEQIRDLLTNLQGVKVEGRPPANGIERNGFVRRDITAVPNDKTPFFKHLGLVNGQGVKDHAFFYVLLDDRLKFDREGPGIIAYGPPAKNSVGQLYTPYIQYEIAPAALNPAFSFAYPLQPEKVEVMPVHFLRENMAANIPHEGPDSKCSYPYSISVIAEGQSGVGGPDTPLLIDPETQTDGPPIL